MKKGTFNEIFHKKWQQNIKFLLENLMLTFKISPASGGGGGVGASPQQSIGLRLLIIHGCTPPPAKIKIFKKFQKNFGLHLRSEIFWNFELKNMNFQWGPSKNSWEN